MKPPVRPLAWLLVGMLAASPAAASKWLYELDGTSQVAFSADSGAGRITGSIPVADARLRLDLDQVSQSSISVVLNAASAKANSPFAAVAMKGPGILDTGHYPTIQFRSTSVTRRGSGVQVIGDLTIRGTTRPVKLEGALSRSQQTDPESLDHLRIHLTGAIHRSAFGASGWSDTVGDIVRLDIIARISRRQ